MNQTQTRTPSPMPVIVGIIMCGAVILTLGWCTKGIRPPDLTPSVTMLEPSADTTTGAELHLVFKPKPGLELLPTGWGTGSYHLHAVLAGVELMPAAADITPRDDSTFVWRVPVPPGTNWLQLVWAGTNHGRIDIGASDSVRVTRAPTRDSTVTAPQHGRDSLPVTSPHTGHD